MFKQLNSTHIMIICKAMARQSRLTMSWRIFLKHMLVRNIPFERSSFHIWSLLIVVVSSKLYDLVHFC